MKRPLMPTPRPSKLSDARLKALLRASRLDVPVPPDFSAQVLERLRAQGLLREPAPAPRRDIKLERWIWKRAAPSWGLALGGALAVVWVLLPGKKPTPRARLESLPRPIAGAVPGGAIPVAVPRSPVPVLERTPIRNAELPVLARITAPAPAPGEPRPSKRPGSPAHEVHPSLLALSAPRSAGSATAPTGSAGLGGAGVGAPQVGVGPLAATLRAPLLSGGLEGLGDGSAAAGAAASGAAAAQRAASMAVPGSKPGPTATPTPTPRPFPTPLPGHFSQVRNNVVLVSRGQSAQILFNVAQSGEVTVVIYSRMGRKVAVLQSGTLAVGSYHISWNGSASDYGRAPSGIYEVIIHTPTYVDRHKIMLVN